MPILVIYTHIHPDNEQRLAHWTLDGAPPAYRERLQRMRSLTARARTRAGLWLLGEALDRQGTGSAALARIGFAAYGRPCIADAPSFSISHSGALVACALAETETVGIDVEARREQVPARLARLLGVAEAETVAGEPTRFFDFWCAREATVKASGRAGLARIRALTLHADWARLDAHDWSLYPLNLLPGYAGCLASDRPITEVDVVETIIPDG